MMCPARGNALALSLRQELTLAMVRPWSLHCHTIILCRRCSNSSSRSNNKGLTNINHRGRNQGLGANACILQRRD
eukprot:scaffold7918_cov165-Amphora_coffeaeformis.AAC.9